jgi:hypothetical protein
MVRTSVSIGTASVYFSKTAKRIREELADF